MKEKMKMEFEPSDLVKLKPEIALWSHVKHDWAYSAKGALFLVLATAPPTSGLSPNSKRIRN